MTTRARYLLAFLVVLTMGAAPAVVAIRAFLVNPQPTGTALASRLSTYVNSKFATCCNPSTTPVFVGGSGLLTTVDGGFPICNAAACTYHDCFKCEDCSSSGIYVRLAARVDAGCLLDGGEDASTLNSNCAHLINCVEGR